MPQRRQNLAVAAAILFVSDPAMAAETKATVRGSAGLSAATNPYLSTAEQVRAMLLELSVEPTLTHATPTSTIALAGRLARRDYSGSLPDNTTGNARVSGSIRTSERLMIQGGASYSRDVSSQFLDDVALDDTAGAIDPRSIRIAKSANASANLLLSEHATLAPSLALTRSSFRGSDSLRGYSSYSSGLGYSRRISSYSTIGLRADAALQRYDGGGSSAVLALLGTGQHRIDEHTTASGGLGAELVSLSYFGFDSKQLLLSGNGSLCRVRLHLNMCVNAAARSEGSGLGSLRRRLSTGLSASYRSNENLSFALAADFQRTSPLGDDPIGPLTFMSARVSVDRKLSKSLTLAAFSNYRRRSGNGSGSSVSVGTALRMSMGQD